MQLQLDGLGHQRNEAIGGEIDSRDAQAGATELPRTSHSPTAKINEAPAFLGLGQDQKGIHTVFTGSDLAIFGPRPHALIFASLVRGKIRLYLHSRGTALKGTRHQPSAKHL